MTRLPIALRSEPLVEAVCELRFAGDLQLADILPGALFSKLGNAQIHRLPTAEIPRQLRAADPNLKYTPIYQLWMEQFRVAIGDRTIGISCVQPYPKWPAFKEVILRVLGHVRDLRIEGDVERYSLKYVNVISAPTIAAQIAKIKLSLRVGNADIKENLFSLRVEQPENGTIHITSITPGAMGVMPDGAQATGIIVDIDSVRNVNAVKFGEFVRDLDADLEALRASNKAKFFGCLTDEAIDAMGPIYE